MARAGWIRGRDRHRLRVSRSASAPSRLLRDSALATSGVLPVQAPRGQTVAGKRRPGRAADALVPLVGSRSRHWAERTTRGRIHQLLTPGKVEPQVIELQPEGLHGIANLLLNPLTRVVWRLGPRLRPVKGNLILVVTFVMAEHGTL